MLKFIEINPMEDATACVIWMHGLGADGNDFVPVVEMLNLPHICFILPHAPHMPVTLNNGYEMPAWYDLYGLTADSKQDADGIKKSQSEIEALIKLAKDKGIPANRVALAGFSQGGAIALHTGLRHSEKLAGIIALSTYLPLKDKLNSEKSNANQAIPIMMAHGSHDDVISIQTAESSRDKLLAEHYAVEWHTYPMPHSVTDQEIQDIQSFLTRTLPKSA